MSGVAVMLLVRTLYMSEVESEMMALLLYPVLLLLALTSAFVFSASRLSPMCIAFVQELNLLRIHCRDGDH